MKKIFFLCCIYCSWGCLKAQSPILVKDICEGSCDGVFESFEKIKILGDRFFFLGKEKDDQSNTWMSDGSTMGTQKFGNLKKAIGSTTMYERFGKQIIGLAAKQIDDTSYLQGLWKFNLDSGNYELFRQNQFGYFTRSEFGTYYTPSESSSTAPLKYNLYKVDTITFETTLIKENLPEPYGYYLNIVANQKKIYFVTRKDIGVSIWVSDGTTSGTKIIGDSIYIKNNQDINDKYIFEFKGNIYFVGSKKQGKEYNFYKINYQNDAIESIITLATSSNTGIGERPCIFKTKDNLFIVLADRIYKYNGKNIGEVQLNKKSFSTLAHDKIMFANHKYFFVYADTNFAYQPKLWRLGESDIDTKIVHNNLCLYPTFVKNKMYFVGSDTNTVSEQYYLWKTDENYLNPQKVYKPHGKVSISKFAFKNLFNFKDELYFIYNDSISGNEFYKFGYTSSLKDEKKGFKIEEINAFPNPFRDFISIENNDFINLPLTIYDINGIKIKDEILTTGTNKIDTNTFNSGVYVFKIQSKDKIYVSKFIKI